MYRNQFIHVLSAGDYQNPDSGISSGSDQSSSVIGSETESGRKMRFQTSPVTMADSIPSSVASNKEKGEKQGEKPADAKGEANQ
jgi:hypothetical protein